MADVKWIKITTDIINSDKMLEIDLMPESDAIFRIWIGLLTLAGKENDLGKITISNGIITGDEKLAARLRRPVKTVQLALNAFEQLNMIEFIDGGDIQIVSWEDTQNIEGMERIKQSNRERQKRFREKKRRVQIECDNVTDNVTSRDRKEEIRTDQSRKQKKPAAPKKKAHPNRAAFIDYMFQKHEKHMGYKYKPPVSHYKNLDDSKILDTFELPQLKAMVDAWCDEYDKSPPASKKWRTPTLDRFCSKYADVAYALKNIQIAEDFGAAPF